MRRRTYEPGETHLRTSGALRKKRYTIVAAGMLSLGALLLAASIGYYAFAHLSKIGQEELVHAVERPKSPVVTISSIAPATTDETNPPRPVQALQPSQTRLPSSVSSVSHDPNSPNHTSEPSNPTDESVASHEPNSPSRTSEPSNPTDEVVIHIHDLPAFGLRGADAHPTVQAAMEAARKSPTAIEEQPTVLQTNIVRLDRPIQPDDPRVAAAVETIILRQARRGMNLPGYVNTYQEDETSSDPTTEFDEDPTPSGIVMRIPSRRSTSPPQTTDHMVAHLEIEPPHIAPPPIEPQPATLMTVPGIGLKALVEELEVVETADSRAWETPKHSVGHIPTTAKPGVSGQGWYFGHLQSPIRGEGSVFRRLPELATRFKKGERFTINLDAGDLRYVYEVYRTDVVHQSELALSDSGQHDITLVTCWPEYVYSERVLVTAALIDVVEVPESDRTSVAMSGP